ncbi:unnamed protein product [Miscanthus lutarioriparius]|uniref:Uncharacterized protein n=1 Tax=Miscanthus lutarioriparius TaxID=422564 RepID=A0A811PXZ8_9POAL|nr:unnamed protein product [Miscanthus lutarioriparius]
MADPQHHAELGQERLREVRQRQVDRGGSSWLTLVGWTFLTFNSFMALYRSGDDFWAIALVSFSYIDLVFLFCYLRWYEREPGSPRRHRIKVAVWLLTTLLTAMFAYKVAAVLPLPVAVLVWAMSGATALGFYAFFVIHDEEAAD